MPQLELSQFVQGYWRLADWKFSEQELLTFIKQHLELGIDSVDHADIYGDYRCEKLFGQALAIEPQLRQKLKIVSKCDIKLCSDQFPDRLINYYDTSSRHIIQSVENSLQRLKTDHLDLLLIHRPDILMDADEVADTFKSLKQSGKVQNFGVSNFLNSQFELLQSRMDLQLVTNQIELNPLNMTTLDDGTMDYLQMKKIRPMIWSALAGGQIFSDQTAKVKRIRSELTTIANEAGAESIDQVIYAWILKLPCNPLLIVGSGNIERVKTAISSSNISLTREQWYRIWVASVGHGVA